MERSDDGAKHAGGDGQSSEGLDFIRRQIVKGKGLDDDYRAKRK